MNSYMITLISASLAAAVVTLLSPKGEGGKLASHVRMVAGLFLLVALLDPLRAGLDLLREVVDGDLTAHPELVLPEGDAEDYGAVFGDTLTSISRAEVETYARSALEASFGIPSEDCTVSAVCIYEEESLTLIELRISLHGSHALVDPHPIEAYFAERLECPCYVTVG
jgi:hypothetical protein